MTWDAVVVGAGPNGLVAANLLVDHGWSVLLVEEQSEPGGAVRSDRDVHPEFVHDTFSSFYPLAAASPVIRGFDLERHGLIWRHAPAVLGHPFPDGTWALGPFEYSVNASNSWWLRIVGWAVVLLACLLVWLLIRSPWGRVLKGIREDEDAVRSLGKNVFAYKMQALIIGGVFGALGGVVFALPSAVVPATYTTSLTFFIWTILLLGGAATVFGPVVGSVIFWVIMGFLGNVLPALANSGILPISSVQAGTLRFILVGVALMLIVIFRPQGIFGNKRELTFVK